MSPWRVIPKFWSAWFLSCYISSQSITLSRPSCNPELLSQKNFILPPGSGWDRDYFPSRNMFFPACCKMWLKGGYVHGQQPCHVKEMQLQKGKRIKPNSLLNGKSLPVSLFHMELGQKGYIHYVSKSSQSQRMIDNITLKRKTS